MSNPFVAEIRIFAGNFAPTGWALSNGQLLPISQNTALFSLLGTMYGGDGKSTFALPNLMDRAAMHQGQGPGLSLRDIGEDVGESAVTLLASEMPVHTHQLMGSGNDATSLTPVGTAGGLASYEAYRADTDTMMNPAALALAGGGQPHNNRQPYLGLTFIIALQGVYPPRS
jgi:microcystin-dependent protein